MKDYIKVYLSKDRNQYQTVMVSHIIKLQQWPDVTQIFLSDGSSINAYHTEQELLTMMGAKG